jgi:hypothetical protein
MGPRVNGCALLAGLAAFAGWTLSRSTVPRGIYWVDLVGGLGILALVFSIVSPNDGSQHELISPATPYVRVSEHTKVGPRRSLAGSPINAFAGAGDPILVLRTDRLVVMGQLFVRVTRFQAPIWIHSPPIAS